MSIDANQPLAHIVASVSDFSRPLDPPIYAVPQMGPYCVTGGLMGSPKSLWVGGGLTGLLLTYLRSSEWREGSPEL